MPLTAIQIEQLENAITGYNFPAVYFNFAAQIEITAPNMATLEDVIASQLKSQEMAVTKCGLANVLYWGFAQIGFRQNRIDNFLNNVLDQQIVDFQMETWGRWFKYNLTLNERSSSIGAYAETSETRCPGDIASCNGPGDRRNQHLQDG